MELKKLNERMFYYPHQPETDRPMLAYLKGEKVALAIDAGNSAAHVDEFYEALASKGLKKPDFTVITHWHWDHTFGMHHIHGLSIAHCKTNDMLENERDRLRDHSYTMSLRKENKFISKEYSNDQKIIVVLSDIQFKDEIVLNLGGMTAEIFHTQSPHSEDTVVIYVPEEKLLFLGDATSEDFFNDGYMDIDKLKALVNLIENIDCEYCILGHTEPIRKQDLLGYLYTLY